MEGPAQAAASSGGHHGPAAPVPHARLIDEIVALDLLTLSEHTERAGDHLEPALLRQSLEAAWAVSERVVVRRQGALMAYAMLQPQSPGDWFVTGFNIHPAHRTAPVLRELFAQLGAIVSRCGIRSLRSNVYKTNRASLAFHARLGFRVTRENAKGVEFTADVAQLLNQRRWLGQG